MEFSFTAKMRTPRYERLRMCMLLGLFFGLAAGMFWSLSKEPVNGWYIVILFALVFVRIRTKSGLSRSETLGFWTDCFAGYLVCTIIGLFLAFLIFNNVFV